MSNEIEKKPDSALAVTAPSTLEIALREESERRKAITQFIASNLKEGVDYGTIQIGGATSKPTLFKPGAEKFCSLLHLRAEFKRDDETLSMLPQAAKDAGAIAFVCRLYKGEELVSEGRGVCSVAEKKGQMNTAVKIAEKRALMDATLRAFSISDSFTQDLDDPERPVAVTGRRNEEETRSEAKAAAKRLGWGKEKVQEFSNYLLKITTPIAKLDATQRMAVYSGIIDVANSRARK